MKPHLPSPDGSPESPADPLRASATVVTGRTTRPTQPMSVAEWKARVANEPVQRVPQMVLSHLYRGGLTRPPGRLIEAKRTYEKPIYPWLTNTATPAPIVTDPTETGGS